MVGAHAQRTRDLPTGPILVAVDGTTSSDAALAAGWLLSDGRDDDAHVVAVIEPMVQGDLGYVSVPPMPPDFYAED